MTSKEAAKYLGISYYYLRNLRHFLHAHEGPEHRMVSRKGLKKGGGLVAWYEIEALDRWKLQHSWRKRKIK